MAKLAGKYARVQFSAGTPAVGPYQWTASLRRERLDVTTFESTLSNDGTNLHTDGVTGPLDTTFAIEGWLDDSAMNIFFPAAQLTIDFLFRKNVALGLKGVSVDVLEFGPSTAIRQPGKFTCNLQSNGLVPLIG